MTDERDEHGARSETMPASAPARLPAGRVGRPHGLDGSFYLTRPRSSLLRVGVVVTVAGRVATVMRLAGTEQRPIVRLEGVEDRAAAEALRGMEVSVEGEPPALADGEWWAHELEGCAVVDGGQTFGTVSRLVELPSCEALEVRRPHGGELLVPMVKDAIRLVAVAQRRIEINADFLDLPAQEQEGRPRRARGERAGETDT